MTPLQRSMILASLSAPGEGLYLVQDVCEVPGNAHLPFLREAWCALVHRHPALSLAVTLNDGLPEGFRPDDRVAEYWRAADGPLEDFLRRDREVGFDFDAGAPLRITAIRGTGSLTLVWTIHHALIDGRSMNQIWREWFETYDALIDGRKPLAEPVLPAPEPQPLPPHAEHFWRDYLSGLQQTTGYIDDRIPFAPPPQAVERQSLALSCELTERLREFAAHHRVTLNTLVQGAWAILLSRYSGRSDVIFGVTRSGRSSSDGDTGKIGCYINTLPLRIAVDPDATLSLWLSEIRTRWLKLREFERTPLSLVAKWGGLPPGLPPFDSLINYDHESPSDFLNRPGVRLRRLQRTDTSLTLAAYGSPVLALELIYDASRCSNYTMSAVVRQLAVLLESFAAGPDAPLNRLNMLPPEEPALLPGRVKEMDLPVLCAHELFEQQAARTPFHIALDTESGSLSYTELNDRANRLASRLHSAGIRPRDLVGVSMDPTPESVIAILAILKAGAAFLPIPTDLPDQRRQAIDAGPSLLLYCGAPPAASISSLEVDTWNSTLDDQPCLPPPSEINSDDLAYVIYTSGSTGTPKAVAVPHRALVNHSLAAASAYEISPTDRRLQMASLGADVYVAEVFNYLTRGAALVFGWERNNRSVRDFLSHLDRRRITITGMPAGWWNEWMAASERSRLSLPGSLRVVIMGMEKADPAAVRRWNCLPNHTVRLFNAYGPAESSPTATVYEVGSSRWECDLYVPIGRPLPNTFAFVLDEHGTPVPTGVPGELYIGGAGLARGYWNRLELTDQRFVTLAAGSSEKLRLYRTGDIVFCLPDGNLVFVGRRDRQVKIRGFRVELDEVETVLAGHPEVKQCAVVLASDTDRPFLGAFTVFRDGDVPREDLRGYLARRLPEYMMPAAFLTVPALPLTPNGKVDRQALPVTMLERGRMELDFQPPSTHMEQRLAEHWRQVLNVWPIGATDNFFDLGADSLHVTRLLALLEQDFRFYAPAALLSRAPTLARMAHILETREIPEDLRHQPGTVVALQPEGHRIPFFCFPGNDGPAYFLPLAVSLGNRQAFYAVRDPRPHQQRGTYTVEQAAERMVDDIRRVHPHGPYILGGHCFGGLLAFEAARLLTQLGETVASVILIDVAAPGYPKLVRSWKNYLRLAARIVRGRRRLSWQEVRRHLNVLAGVIRKQQQPSPTPPSPSAEEPLHQPPPPVHPNVQAGRLYNPKPFACHLVQIAATGASHSTEVLDDPRLGWRDLATASFHMVEVEGVGEDLYRQPLVAKLAAHIDSVLDTINRRYSRTHQSVSATINE
jgi:amino acid adenylation domain-containing protein